MNVAVRSATGIEAMPAMESVGSTVTVWAPTARRVELMLWDEVPPPGHDGAWTPSGDAPTTS